MRYEYFITSIITKHQWRQFYAHPTEAVVLVVREFYTHFAGEGQRSVYVRGVQVSIDEDTINQFYGLEDGEDLHTEYAADAPADRLECALTNDRVLLLDSITSGQPIDVGKIISQKLGAYATKKCGSLWFPSLITSLCASSGVPIFDNEERLLSSRGAITNTFIARLIQTKMAEGPSEPPRNDEDELGQAPPTTTNRAAAASSNQDPAHADLTQSLKLLEQRMSHAEVQQYQTMDMLQQMHSQQQQYWNYAKRRDLALNKSLQKNFTKPIFPFPEFPDDVLAPVAAKEATDEVDEDGKED
ncbi:hypothetical protein TIFTF001_034567 [Ficus carica]|uniref:Putative plant transposon protein domain-containing protein n=1 Tax=Ficus carica TaxID=3494 RepID=A0AA88J994_FICCA|nr:hypothetical protein TIFTF001_034567 [Ficus carica]